MKKQTTAKLARSQEEANSPAPATPSRRTVLHVDDDPNDAELFRAASHHARARFTLQNAGDGEEAIAYLSGAGAYADRKRFKIPDLVLLDLKMPRATGFDVLQWIRAHPGIKSVPVVIFSGSELEDDIHRAYQAGANSYLVKPLSFEALVELIKRISEVWLVPEPA